MTHEHIPDTRFNGQWIGETQGCEMPAHLWEIRQQGRRLSIQTRWDGETQTAQFYGQVLAERPAFALGNDFTAILIDSQHFIIAGWCTNDKRGGIGPGYDVVFSRPGVAELMAHAVWQRYQAQIMAESGATTDHVS